MAEKFPARVHPIFARDARTAIIFRRGPSKSVCTVLWDRDKDEFALGQWLRGRIYERRSDISPDGKYLIYFAMNGKWDSETKGAWTAISRTPWLKAITLMPKGDCWNGGGLFTENRKYWLNDGFGHECLQSSSEVQRDEAFQSESYGGECPGVYYVRLQRDGWNLTARPVKGKRHLHLTFEKSLPKRWLLKKIANEQLNAPKGKGVYWDEHELENEKSGERLARPDWEWAELDDKTLVYAEKGCLYRCPIKSEEALGESTLLCDFNPMKFEPIAAPY